ncbi:MAG: DUF4265 domain-containing protein [Gemmatimonadaceae bacterium]
MKILFESGGLPEAMYGEPVGPGIYRIENIPFLVYGISYLDVVAAEPNSNGELRFQRVVAKSGHRTLRCGVGAVAKDAPCLQVLADALAGCGAGWEGMGASYLSIDLPPHVPINAVIEVLISEGWDWEHADPPPPEPMGWCPQWDPSTG